MSSALPQRCRPSSAALPGGAPSRNASLRWRKNAICFHFVRGRVAAAGSDLPCNYGRARLTVACSSADTCLDPAPMSPSGLGRIVTDHRIAPSSRRRQSLHCHRAQCPRLTECRRVALPSSGSTIRLASAT